MHLDLPPRRLLDLRVLGAATLPGRELVRLVCGPRVSDGDVDDATRALELAPATRDAVLLSSPCGPRLLAALELGRRAARIPSPAHGRLHGPADVVAAVSPRLVDDARWWLVALDVRLRIARLVPIDLERRPACALDDGDGGDGEEHEAIAVTALQQALGVGCRRLLLVRRGAAAAAPGAGDVALLTSLRRRAGVVGVAALDVVVLGDDGWCSLVRLGFAGPLDQRYR